MSDETQERRLASVYTVTCLGTRVFRGSIERDRIMAICTTIERARDIVECNANDIHETSFGYAVIEQARLNGAYPEVGATEESEWYEWEGEPDEGHYVRRENEHSYRKAIGAAYAERYGLLSLVDSQGEALRAAKQDTERLNWSVRRSAMLFRRETPEPEVMVAFYPLAQDGFLAAEYEGRDVPVNTPSVRLADFGGDVNTAFRHLIDEARSASPRVSTEGRDNGR